VGKIYGRLGIWFLLGLSVLLLMACEPEQEESGGISLSPTVTETAAAVVVSELAPFVETTGRPDYLFVAQPWVAVAGGAGVQSPAYVTVSAAGFDIAGLVWRIGRYEENCQRLLSTGTISPVLAGEGAGRWPDGLHQMSFSWPAEGYFLSDAEKGDFVFVQAGEAIGVIGGRFRSAARGQTVDANLLVDRQNSRPSGIQSTSGQELIPELGDGFQLFDRCLAADGAVLSVPGVELLFGEAGILNLEQRPLPSGDYFLNLEAVSPENGVMASTDFAVNNDRLYPNYDLFLDTESGYQFLYPAGWPAPVLQDGRWLTAAPDGSLTLAVATHPQMAGRSAADLKNQALSRFGGVTVLYEDEVPVGDGGGLWTAYGYEASDGSHTGVLLAFNRDGIGHSVDVDGLASAEALTLELMKVLAESWVFRPDVTRQQDNVWTWTSFEQVMMPVWTDYYQEELANGWRRFSVRDGISFMAIRLEPGGQSDLSSLVTQWRNTAGNGVADFAGSQVYPFPLNDREWTRTDFSYLGEGSLEIRGFVMAAEVNGRILVAWAEFPVTRFEEQSALFLLSLASLR
jgi:hypothetical protein